MKLAHYPDPDTDILRTTVEGFDMMTKKICYAAGGKSKHSYTHSAVRAHEHIELNRGAERSKGTSQQMKC